MTNLIKSLFTPKLEDVNKYDSAGFTKLHRACLTACSYDELYNKVKNLIDKGALIENMSINSKKYPCSILLDRINIPGEQKMDENSEPFKIIKLLTNEENKCMCSILLFQAITNKRHEFIVNYFITHADGYVNMGDSITKKTIVDIAMDNSYPNSILQKLTTPSNIKKNNYGTYFKMIENKNYEILRYIESFNIDLTNVRNNDGVHIVSYAIKYELNMDYMNTFINDITILNDEFCEFLYASLKANNYNVFIKLIINDNLNLDKAFNALDYLSTLTNNLYYKYVGALFEYCNPSDYVKRVIVLQGRQIMIQKYLSDFIVPLNLSNNNVNSNNNINIDNNIVLDNNNECKICFTNKSNSTFIGCGHSQFCYDCVEKLTICPVCRQESKSIKTFN